MIPVAPSMERRLVTLENLVLEIRTDLNKQMDGLEVQKRTMIAAVKALRAEVLEREKEKEKEKEEEVEEKNMRRRKRLPPALMPTVPMDEQHFHQPTASTHKKHVYLVDGKMTTDLGHAAASGNP